jgi:hypothetical protein
MYSLHATTLTCVLQLLGYYGYFATISFVHKCLKVAYILIMVFLTTHNVMHVCQVVVSLKLLCAFICYSSLIQVDVFILTCMHTKQIVAGILVECASVQQRVGRASNHKCILMFL